MALIIGVLLLLGAFFGGVRVGMWGIRDRAIALGRAQADHEWQQMMF